MIRCQVANTFKRANGGQAQGAVSVGAKVQSVFDDCSGWLVTLLEFPQDGLLVGTQVASRDICDKIRKNIDSLLQVVLEAGQSKRGLLTACGHSKRSTHRLDLALQGILRSLFGASECQLLDEMGCSSRLCSLTSCTSIKEDTDACNLAERLLRGNSKA